MNSSVQSRPSMGPRSTQSDSTITVKPNRPNRGASTRTMGDSSKYGKKCMLPEEVRCSPSLLSAEVSVTSFVKLGSGKDTYGTDSKIVYPAGAVPGYKSWKAARDFMGSWDEKMLELIKTKNMRSEYDDLETAAATIPDSASEAWRDEVKHETEKAYNDFIEKFENGRQSFTWNHVDDQTFYSHGGQDCGSSKKDDEVKTLDGK